MKEHSNWYQRLTLSSPVRYNVFDPKGEFLIGTVSRRSLMAAFASALVRAQNPPAIPGKRPMLLQNDFPEDLETPSKHFDSWRTPNDVFFVRQHLPRPSVDAASFRLKIDGRVSKPVEMTIEDLHRLPAHDVPATLECTGNGRAFYRPRVPGMQWSRGAIGNAVWRGPRLADVLKTAGFDASAPYVTFNGADTGVGQTPDFVRSFPMKKLLDPSTIVALEMNGERLPDLHGFPTRLIMPGWDGASWVKWLTNVTVQNEPVKGFFMYPAYCYPKHAVEPGKAAPADDLAMIEAMPVKSIIGSPEENAEVSGALTVSGVAWSGEETIERVDISTDGGSLWSPATLSSEKVRSAWRLFKYEWKPAKPGYYTILSRATDSAGHTQPVVSPWNPSGYLWNAIDRVGVKVKG